MTSPAPETIQREQTKLYLSDAELIRQRMSKRSGHFMPTVLLQSQFDTLEEPGPDENPIVVPIDAEPRMLAVIRPTDADHRPDAA